MIWRLVAAVLLWARGAWWKLVYRGYRSQYRIDPSFRFNGAGIQLYGSGTINLADHSYIGEHSSIQAADGCVVTVGSYCSIAHNVRIYTSTGDADSAHGASIVSSKAGSVSIGDGCWIGVNVYIAPGVSVGEHSVVGANSVVTRSIPAFEIWGGVPARLIRRKRTSTGASIS